MAKFFQGLIRDERGISALEYAILAGIIIVAVVAGVVAFGDNIKELFGNAGTALEGAVDSSSNTGNTAGGS